MRIQAKQGFSCHHVWPWSDLEGGGHVASEVPSSGVAAIIMVERAAGLSSTGGGDSLLEEGS